MISNLQHSGNRWTYSSDQYQVILESAGDCIIRCVCSIGKPLWRDSLLVLPGAAGNSELAYTSLPDGGFSLMSGHLRLDIAADGRFVWRDGLDGRLLVAEKGKVLTQRPLIVYDTQGSPPRIERVRTVDGERNFISNMQAHQEGVTCTASLEFAWQPGEAIHGLGQGEDGIYNYRGHVQYLYQHNMRTPIPFFISTRGYGVLIDCCSLMTFRDDEAGSGVWCDAVPYLDYYFIAGDKLDTIISGFRRLTGSATLLPRWAFGFVQSREAYTTGEELVDVARRYRELSIPLDCVVQDWNTWRPGQWGQKTVDPARYPDLTGTLSALHQYDVHGMVSIWPNMNAGCPDHSELAEHDGLLLDYSTYNAFDAKARDLYWRQAERGLFSQGFDAWWCDSTEPFSGPDWNGETKRAEYERFHLVGDEHKKYLGEERANAFALVHAQGIFEHQRQTAPEKRVLNLTRSGYPGSQRYGTVLWSGDITATWTTMRNQIIEGLNFSMSGMPWWTMDAGGFFVVHDAWQKRGCGCSGNPNPLWFWQGDFDGGVEDPAYRELYVRWMQLACFLPMFRSHGTDTPRELWHYGQPGESFYEALVRAVRLRYDLLPAIYSAAAEVVLDGGSLLRSLLFDFADDPQVHDLCDQFMFGRSLLVCPVLEPYLFAPGAVPVNRKPVRKCYLPAGTRWYSLISGEVTDGGRYIEVMAPLDIIPVFVRAGSILAISSGLIHANNIPAESIKLKIYPGADGHCLLYQDSGDGYGYESGEYVRIPLQWNDKSKILTMGSSTGHGYPGQPAEMPVTVVYGPQERRVYYTGEELAVLF